MIDHPDPDPEDTIVVTPNNFGKPLTTKEGYRSAISFRLPEPCDMFPAVVTNNQGKPIVGVSATDWCVELKEKEFNGAILYRVDFPTVGTGTSLWIGAEAKAALELVAKVENDQ